MRTVRAAARARNRPKAPVAALLFVVVAVLAFLVTRAAASPMTFAPPVTVASNALTSDDDDNLDEDAPDAGGGANTGGPGSPAAPGDPGNGELPPDAATPIAGAPAVAATIAAGYAAAGLDHDPSGGWNTRSRLAGLIPQVSLVDGIDSSWHDIDPNIGRRLVFQVRATWRFDRLLFDQTELRVATIDASRRRDKRRISSRIIRAYFMWRRAMAAARVDTRWSIRADEASAELDALTSGWFSAELARNRRQGLSAARTAR